MNLVLNHHKNTNKFGNKKKYIYILSENKFSAYL
jgi:hypothetical protein